jgi:hypothetical protein
MIKCKNFKKSFFQEEKAYRFVAKLDGDYPKIVYVEPLTKSDPAFTAQVHKTLNDLCFCDNEQKNNEFS